jgi:hypothetical protein
LALLPIIGCIKQRHLHTTWAAVVLVCIVDSAVDMTLPYSLAGSNVDIGIRLKHLVVLLLSGFAVIVSRYIVINRSHSLVSIDRAKYDALWQSELESEDGYSSIIHLASVVRMLGLDVTDEKTYNSPMHQAKRQLMYLEPYDKIKKTQIAPLVTRERVKGEDHLFASLNALYAQRTIDKKSHVQCLGQIYMQAIVANGLMVRKVQQWALKTNGFFRLHDTLDRTASQVGSEPQVVRGKFIKWADAKDNPSKVDSIKWPPLKRHRRIIEKLMRVYNVGFSEAHSPQTLFVSRIIVEGHTRGCAILAACTANALKFSPGFSRIQCIQVWGLGFRV